LCGVVWVNSQFFIVVEYFGLLKCEVLFESGQNGPTT
jgi:hypothetical protein